MDREKMHGGRNHVFLGYNPWIYGTMRRLEDRVDGGLAPTFFPPGERADRGQET